MNMQYRPNEQNPQTVDAPEVELASPWARLAAVIIDVLLYVVLSGVLFFILEVSSKQDPAVTGFTIIGANIVLFVVQMVLLGMRGQTIGKMLLRVRVVDAQTGQHPGWARIVLLRTVVNWVLVGIPFVGWIYWLVDSLFIFRADHRTIHDMIGSTRVDKA